MALEDKRVLFISYNGMLDPLGQSQVIPYLRELSKEGVQFTLLSFEHDTARGAEGAARCGKLCRYLAAHNIDWHWLRYHQRPSLPATVYDVIAGVCRAQELVRRNRIEIVHARSYIPATIALALKRCFRLKMIFDMRGLMAEEYVSAGLWREGSIPFRLTKKMERCALAASDGVVTLTENIWPIIKEWEGLRGRDVAHQVIPCCTDLELFKFEKEARARRRAELNVQDRFVVVYSGSIGGWYLMEEMADFFVALLRVRGDAHFLWLTPSAPDRIEKIMRERDIAPHQYTVRRVTNADVPSYLSASEAGLAFIKPCFSKLASSPIKMAEYLACGLPLIINAGVGDSDKLITREGAGALVRDFTEPEYSKAAATIVRMLKNIEGTRRQTRDVARRLFDVHDVGLKGYASLYENLSDKSERPPTGAA